MRLLDWFAITETRTRVLRFIILAVLPLVAGVSGGLVMSLPAVGWSLMASVVAVYVWVGWESRP